MLPFAFAVFVLFTASALRSMLRSSSDKRNENTAVTIVLPTVIAVLGYFAYQYFNPPPVIEKSWWQYFAFL